MPVNENCPNLGIHTPFPNFMFFEMYAPSASQIALVWD